MLVYQKIIVQVPKSKIHLYLKHKTFLSKEN